MKKIEKTAQKINMHHVCVSSIISFIVAWWLFLDRVYFLFFKSLESVLAWIQLSTLKSLK